MEAFVSHIKVAAVLSWRLGTLMVSLAALATDGVSGTDGSEQVSRSSSVYALHAIVDGVRVHWHQVLVALTCSITCAQESCRAMMHHLRCRRSGSTRNDSVLKFLTDLLRCELPAGKALRPSDWRYAGRASSILQQQAKPGDDVVDSLVDSSLLVQAELLTLQLDQMPPVSSLSGKE